jgi:YgiT-type zinc finger domain-containing protein
MKAITICPSCGSTRIRQVQRNWSREYQGHRYAIKNLRFFECPDCGENVYDREAMRAIEANSPAFTKSVSRD